MALSWWMDSSELGLGEKHVQARPLDLALSLLGPLGEGSGAEQVGRIAPAHTPLKEDQNFLPRVELPYSRAGLLMEKTSGYVKLSIRLVLTFLWNEDSALVRTLTHSSLQPPITLHKPYKALTASLNPLSVP